MLSEDLKFQEIELDRYEEVEDMIVESYLKSNKFSANGLFPVDEIQKNTRSIRKVYEDIDKTNYPFPLMTVNKA